MNIRNKISLTLLIAATGFSGATLAAGVSPYVYDSSKTIVRDGAGDCLFNGHGDRTPEWKATCDGIVPVAEKAPEPAPEQKTLATRTLNAVTLFDFDKADLKPEGKRALDGLVSEINSDLRVRQVRITGHTCSIGTDEYNQGLSERRANSVKNYLVEKGIDAGKIEAVGKGESSPVASNSTREGRAQNRRVEVELIGVSGH